MQTRNQMTLGIGQRRAAEEHKRREQRVAGCQLAQTERPVKEGYDVQDWDTHINPWSTPQEVFFKVVDGVQSEGVEGYQRTPQVNIGATGSRSLEVEQLFSSPNQISTFL